MLPISLGYNDTGSAELRQKMAKAIYYSLLGIPPTSISAAASCPSGECTWQAYDTLAVCSLCENVTAKHPEGPWGGTNPCHEAPSGPAVGPKPCLSPFPYRSPPSTRFFNAYIYFESITSKKDQFGDTPQSSRTYDCSLSWCTRSFSSATATAGVLVETHGIPPNVTYISNGTSCSSSSSSEPHTGGNNPRIFTVDESSNFNLNDALNQLLYSAIFSQYIPDDNALVNGSGNSHFFADPTLVFNNIANAISTQLRTIPFSSSSSSSSHSPPNTTTTTTTPIVAPGTAFYRKPVLVVQWGWLAFPAFLLFATAFLLFLVIVTARNPVWKDSLWPLIFLARPRQGAIRIGQGHGHGWAYALGDMKRIAGVRVRLQRAGRGRWGFTLGRPEEG